MKNFSKLLSGVLLIVCMVSCGEKNEVTSSKEDFNAVVFMQEMLGKSFNEVDNALKAKGYTMWNIEDKTMFLYTINVSNIDSIDAELSTDFEETKQMLYVMFANDELYSLQLVYYGTQEKTFNAMCSEKDEMLRVMKATSPIVCANDGGEWYFKSFYNVIAEVEKQRYSNYLDLVLCRKEAGEISSEEYDKKAKDFYAEGNLEWSAFEKICADLSEKDIDISGVSDWYKTGNVFEHEMLYAISYRLKNGEEYPANTTVVFMLHTQG